MTFSKILCLNLIILILSVHGHEVVARIRFQSTHYTVSEENPTICIPVENTAAPAAQDFSVSFSFDPILIGSQMEIPVSSPRQGSIRFSAASSTSSLCFAHIDDDIACEANIVGQVRLINSSAVIVIEPSTATVTIEDDDAASVGFKTSSHTYYEGGLSSGDSYPTIQSSHPSLPASLQVSEVQHSSVFVFPSLSVPDTLISVASIEVAFQLSIHDDDVALEAPEAIILELSVSHASCSRLDLIPFNQTQITIIDDDVVSVGLEEQTVTVSESDRSVQVCVSLSTRIARHLAFTLSMRNGTAKNGEDFTGRSIPGLFMPLSDQTRLCYNIDITFDSVMEGTESFTVHFAIGTSLPNEVRERLTVANALTTVVIEDSSDCYKMVLDGRSDEAALPHFVPKSSTICFDCLAYEPIEIRGRPVPHVLWLLNSLRLSNNDHFANGRVMSNGTLMITNSSKSFDLSSATTIGCANNLNDPAGNTQQEVVNFHILLGAPPQAISLVSSDHTPSNSASSSQQRLTCLCEGVPQPQVEWLLNGRPLDSGFSSEESIVPEEENRYKSVLKIPEDKPKGTSTYSCVCKNQFGEDQRSITLREPNVVTAGGIRSDSRSMRGIVELIFSLLVFVLCLF